MDLVLSLALRVGLLLYCLFVPGWAVLRAAGFSSVVEARPAAGVPRGRRRVYEFDGHDPSAGRSLLPSRRRPVAHRAARVPRVEPDATGARQVWQPMAGLIRSHHRRSTPSIVPSSWRRLASSLVYLLDAWTSPITWWDGLASWGKWAADWGRRTSSAHYVVGGYPQLVPRLVSVMYKADRRALRAPAGRLLRAARLLRAVRCRGSCWRRVRLTAAPRHCRRGRSCSRASVRCSSASTPAPARWTSWSVRW